jgi:hypothetical protein
MKEEENKINNEEAEDIYNYEEKKANKEGKKIRDLFFEYSNIVEQEKLKKFIYKCLFLDFVAIFLYSYELLENFMIIDGQLKGFLYLLKYISSFINGILYIYFIILCNKKKDKTTKDKKINGEKRNPPVYEYLKLYVNKDYKNFNYNLDGNIILNDKERIIRLLYIFKLWTWFLKYISYIIFMIIDENWHLANFYSIIILIIDYYQYHLNKIYYYVILRSKNILQNFLLYEMPR